MTPQSYYNLIINYVNAKLNSVRHIEDKIFTEEDLYTYCISHADRIDDGEQIKLDLLYKRF